jgi:RNA polymerase sigma-70 factor, ECF subfamily
VGVDQTCDLFVQKAWLGRCHGVLRVDSLPSMATEASSNLDGASALARFHAGERDFFGQLYRDTYQAVDMAVGRVLHGADRDTVVHDLYLRLLSRPELRQKFTGGSLHAWLATLAHNLAVDFWRHRRRETSLQDREVPPLIDPMSRRVEERAELNLFVERFRRDGLPEELWPLFQARFLERLDQREAARRLGMHRTTLAYRELRVRRCLRAFLRRN